ncbi:hypothetical protein ABPG75_005624 [Micractinium tetrahymenae]
MSGARLLRQAGRLCSLSFKSHATPAGLPTIAAALQGAPNGIGTPSLQRSFSDRPGRGSQDQQAGRAIHHQQQQQQEQQTQRHERGGRVHRAGRRHGGQQQRHPQTLYIPAQWHEQAPEQDKALPLVKEMRQLIDAGRLQEARHMFEAAVAPLEAAVEQEQQPAAADVPPPYAWKLHFAVLAALSASSLHMSNLLGLMRKLELPPQPACYVIALRQMARQGVGHPAYTTIAQMKDLGIPPTLRCYMFGIEANLRAQPPEHNFARKLFDEVAELGLASHPSQKTELGKLLMHAAQDFARHRRFGHADALLDQLEGMGLRVPAFLVADVLQLAVQAGHSDAMQACLRRLEAATSTFQLVPGEGRPITRPLKVEEGLLLAVLEAAASKGDVPLAEAAWRLLERSLALPNPPSTWGALNTHLSRARELQRQEQEEGEEAEGLLAEAEAGAEATGEGGGGAAAGEGGLDQLSAELEAAELGAAEVAQGVAAAAAAQQQPDEVGGGDGGSAPPLPAGEWSELARDEARALAAQPRGVRAPSLLSHLALVHAYAKAGELEGMFRAVTRVEEAFPEAEGAAAYHTGLPMCVDALAASVHTCDQAFFLLEGWAKEGLPVSTAQLNLVVAAYSQMGDLKRTFETFDSYGHLGVVPDADTYSALMQGCIECGRVDTALKVFEQLQEAGVEPNAFTHHQLVDASVVLGDVPSMMTALEAMDEAGHSPRLALLERCVARAERAGDREAVRQLMLRLFENDYRIIGVDAKWRRWVPEGGMQMLTGSSQWFSREEVVRELRKDHSISTRIARRHSAQQQQRRQPEQQQQAQRLQDA